MFVRVLPLLRCRWWSLDKVGVITLIECHEHYLLSHPTYTPEQQISTSENMELVCFYQITAFFNEKIFNEAAFR